MVVSIVLPDSSPTFQDGLSFKTRKWRWSICHDPQVTGLRVRPGRLYEGPAVVKFDVLGSGVTSQNRSRIFSIGKLSSMLFF